MTFDHNKENKVPANIDIKNNKDETKSSKINSKIDKKNKSVVKGSSNPGSEDEASFEIEKLKLYLQLYEKKLSKMQDLESRLKDSKKINRALEDELFLWKE